MRPAPEVLQLPLRASARLRLMRRLYMGVVVLYAVELALRLHPIAAPGVLLIAVFGVWPARGQRLRCLRFECDGGLRIQSHAGQWEPVQLGAASLFLGNHVLLVLRGSRRLRLLLGPDNLAPHELAALRRRLRVGPGGAASALHSVAAPGSQSTELP